jgi:hypothetical protein
MFKIGLAIIFVNGCSTTYDIRTKPSGSKMYVGSKLIGTTPLNFSSGDAPTLEAKGVFARIEADGYQRLFIWLPDDGKHYDLTFNLTPFLRKARVDNAVGDLDLDRLDLYRLSDILLNMQTNLFTGAEKNLTPIAQEIKRLTEANPTMGSLYFLDALRLLRDGKTEDGKKALQSALKFSPNEYDFLSLLNELQQGTSRANGKP